MADNRTNQAISEGLIRGGITQLGNIGVPFQTKEQAAATIESTQQMANATVQAMRTRFWKKEYEQLTDLYIKPAMQRMQQVQDEFVAGTTPAIRTIARSASQEELQMAADEARKAAPGPQKNAKDRGPADAGLGSQSLPGQGSVKMWEAPSYLDPDTGEPVDANSAEASDVIRKYKVMASQRYQQEFMGLMDQLAEYPNNPFAGQAISQMMKNLTEQMNFATTGRKDRVEAEEHISQMQLNESEYQSRMAETEAQQLTNKGAKELRAAAPVLREAAYLSDVVPELYEGFDTNYFKNPKPDDIPVLRALNARARSIAEKRETLDVQERLRERKLKERVMPDSAPITWPQQYRATREYKDAFERAVGPVMGDLRSKWASDANFRNRVVQELGAGAHLAKIQDATDDQVSALLTQYAIKEHPERANQAESAAFAQIYETDPEHRKAVDEEMARQRQQWISSGHEDIASTFDEILNGPIDPSYPNEKYDLMHLVIKMQDPTLTAEQRQRLYKNSSLRKRAVAREEARRTAMADAAAAELASEPTSFLEQPTRGQPEVGDFEEQDTRVEEEISQPTDNRNFLSTPILELVGRGLVSLSKSAESASENLQRAREDEIIRKDTTGMTKRNREWYERKKQEILSRRQQERSARESRRQRAFGQNKKQPDTYSLSNEDKAALKAIGMLQ